MSGHHITIPKHARERVFAALHKEYPEISRADWDQAIADKKLVLDGPEVHARVTKALLNEFVKGDDPMTKNTDKLAELERQLEKVEAAVDKAERQMLAGSDDDSDQDDEDSAVEYDDLDQDDDDSDQDDDEDLKEGRAPDLAKATKFQAQVDLVAHERGIPKTQAARLVREQYPDIAAGYDALPETSKSYRSLVQAEIAKGCSPVVAAQRVCHAHPTLAQSAIAKGDTDATRFMAKVSAIMKRDGLSRTEAMRKARLEAPNAFAKFSEV